MRINWDDLRLFLAVARTQSLSGAGKALALDPATVGRRIQRLEEGLQTSLFSKSPQGYVLNPEGERFLTRAEQAEQAIALAAEESQGEPGLLAGSIRLGAPDGCANFLLPQVCADISRRHPDLDIQIVAQPRVVNLSRREADMAIVVSPPNTGRLTVQKISDYRLHLAAHRDYLARHGPIDTLGGLSSHRMVGYVPDMIFDQELDYLPATGVEKVALASNSISVQVNLLRQAVGVGIVHDFSLPFWPEGQKVLTREFSLTRAFYLIRHADDRKLERMNRFAVELVEGIRKEITRLEACA